MCRPHLLPKLMLLYEIGFKIKHVKINAQARMQVNLFKGMPMNSVCEIQPAMEITFVKTLPYNHSH